MAHTHGDPLVKAMLDVTFCRALAEVTLGTCYLQITKFTGQRGWKKPPTKIHHSWDRVA
jgi:hypothetical protein